MQSDIFRVCYLLQKGGIYIDVDIDCFACLDNLCTYQDFDCFLLYAQEDEVCIENGFMICKPQNKVIETYLEKIQQNLTALITFNTIWECIGPDPLSIGILELFMKLFKEFSAPQLISDSHSLKKMVASLLEEKFVTMDTEFVRESTYWPELCLIQIAGSDQVYLVDALSEAIDLSLLTPLLRDPGIVKVFHAAQQDLEIFLHLFGFLPVSIFDTQIAAMVAGFGNQIGYDSLVESLLDHKIDKSHRFSDWSMRPLTKAQQDYAVADVTYLWNVYPILLEKLQKDDRLSWVASEIERLSHPDFYLPPLEKIWKKLGAKIRNGRSLAGLYHLVQWRENKAQQVNVPRHHVIRDESLIAIAVALPDSVKALGKIRGVSKEFANSQEGQALLEVIKQTKAMDPELLPIPFIYKNGVEKPSEALVSLLKVMLLAKCEAYQVAPKLVASSKEIEKIALGDRNMEVFTGWRYRVFGKDAVDLCEGKLMITVQDKALKFIKV